MANTKIIDVVVAGHSVWKGQPKVDLQIDAWSTDYPMPLYRVSEETQAALPLNAHLKVELKPTNQKKDTDGSAPWHYFWDFVRIVGDDEPAPKKPNEESQVSKARWWTS